MIQVNTDHPITNNAIKVWGVEGQKAILMEECAECISALVRHSRGRTNTDPVAEEIADVLISIMSVIPALKIEEQVKKHMLIKINRLKDRIDHGNKS